MKMYVYFCAHLMYNSVNICWQQNFFLTKLAEKNEKLRSAQSLLEALQFSGLLKKKDCRNC